MKFQKPYYCTLLLYNWIPPLPKLPFKQIKVNSTFLWKLNHHRHQRIVSVKFLKKYESHKFTLILQVVIFRPGRCFRYMYNNLTWLLAKFLIKLHTILAVWIELFFWNKQCANRVKLSMSALFMNIFFQMAYNNLHQTMYVFLFGTFLFSGLFSIICRFFYQIQN